MGTSLKGMNSLEGANSFLKGQFLKVWKINFTTKVSSLECYNFYYARAYNAYWEMRKFIWHFLLLKPHRVSCQLHKIGSLFMLKKTILYCTYKTILVKNSHSLNSQILSVHIGNFNVYQQHMKKKLTFIMHFVLTNEQHAKFPTNMLNCVNLHDLSKNYLLASLVRL